MTKEKVFHFYWGGVFIALPLFLKGGSQPTNHKYPHEMFLFYSALVSIVLFGFFSKGCEKTKIISATLGTLVFLNASDFTSFAYVTHVFCIFSILMVGLQFKSNKYNGINILLNGIAISAIIQSIIGIFNTFGVSAHDLIYQFFGYGLARGQGTTEAIGTLGNTNVLGSFLAISFPVFFRKKWIFFTPLILVTIYLCYSTTPYIVLAAVFVGYLYKRLGSYAYLTPSLGLGLTYLIVKSGFFINHRTTVWNIIFYKAGLKNMFFGWGTAFIATKKEAWRTSEGTFIYAHNEYLELFYNYGLAGVGILSVYFYMCYKPKNRILNAILFGSLASSMTHFNLHIVITSLLFILAVCYNYQKETA